MIGLAASTRIDDGTTILGGDSSLLYFCLKHFDEKRNTKKRKEKENKNEKEKKKRKEIRTKVAGLIDEKVEGEDIMVEVARRIGVGGLFSRVLP